MPIPSPSSVLLRTQSDERLVVLARSGHERAFEAIVERYRGPLMRACRHYLPEARAEDALQHAYIAAWRALQRGDEVRDLRAWLYRIVHNTALNQLRIGGYDYAELEESLRGGEAPQEEMERRAVVRQALTGLAALPDRQREALLKVAVEGRSQEEVALALGVSEGAVRQLVHRARITLRAAATVLVPMPLAQWAAAAGSSGAAAPTAERIGELVAGAGAGAFATKAATVGVIATTAVAGPAIVTSGSDPPPQKHERAPAAQERRAPEAERVAPPPVRVRSTPGEPGAGPPSRQETRGRSEDRPGPRRGGRNRGPGGTGSGSSGSGSSGSGSSGSGSSGSGSSGSGSSGSGSSGSGSSGSGSSGSGSSGSGSSGSGSSGSESGSSGSSSVPGSGDGSEDNSGPGSGGDSGDSSGPGSGGDDSSGSGSSGSGSGSSGSGSSGSGSDDDD
jgi:RNA polymerase sigma factor (sigma-70 family)